MNKDLNRPSNFYICDPIKNMNCNGRFKESHCGTVCFCTTKPDFAVVPVHMLTYAEYYKEAGKRSRINKAIKL